MAEKNNKAAWEQDQIEKFIDLLNTGKIKPDHTVNGSDDWGTSKFSLLQFVLNADTLSVEEKYNYIKRLIALGCDVDQMVSNWTPLEMVCSGSSSQDYIPIALLMLRSHKFGDLSELNVLKSAAKSLNRGMFELLIDSGKINMNATALRGTHILHYLAEEPTFSGAIGTLIIKVPDLEVNPVNRHGFSPLTIAINKENVAGIGMLKGRPDTKIIGKVHKPELVVDHGLASRYDGNFFGDFPQMIEYAIEMKKEYLLPKEIADIFLF